MHKDVLIINMKSVKLRLNLKTSVITPSGMNIDSTTPKGVTVASAVCDLTRLHLNIDELKFLQRLCSNQIKSMQGAASTIRKGTQ